MTRDAWGTDDPRRVAGPDELPSDSPPRERDPDYDRDMRLYEGSLLADCTAARTLGQYHNMLALEADERAANEAAA